MSRLLSLTRIAVFLFIFVTDALGWGFWAHREIHRYAIQSLPEEMQPFFTAFADTIIARSVEADRRRNSDPTEEFHHFIDIDRYGSYPFRELPRQYEEAVAKFGKTKVDSNGTAPWRIADFMKKLTDAMKRKDKADILFYASNIGHYVADIHVPLHTTENYDGQLTNQKGLHARWESRIPEMFGKTFNLQAQPATYISDPLNFAFEVVLESYAKVDSVLNLDLKAREGIPEEELFKVTQRRGRTEYQLSDRYFQQYHELLNGMVENQMQRSIKAVASCWYTAWVDAGKPDLSEISLR
ncbi:MAG TPA: zinc dependent phospholipase C family protein [Bacteroidota bacterium]|nr:zinc dependent phospholipase C family protein [Bacteroidota bacterium]